MKNAEPSPQANPAKKQSKTPVTKDADGHLTQRAMKTKTQPTTTRKQTAKAGSHQSGADKKPAKATKEVSEGSGKQRKEPFGRPTDYRPEMCAEVIRMGKEGKSYTQIADVLDVRRETLYAWAKTKPDFSNALSRARDAAQAWWENAGQTGLVTPGFSASLWQKNVSCRFPDDWREVTRQENTGKDGGPILQQHKVDVKISAEDAYKQMLGGT